MTIIKTQINGQPFEIEVEDDIELVFSEGKIIAKRRVPDAEYVPAYPIYPIYPLSWNPWWNPYFPLVVSHNVLASDANGQSVTANYDAVTFTVTPQIN